MPRQDPRIDAYIANAAPFARPILKHLRKLIHAGCPEVEETMKWKFPHFDYKGILCGMAAFQNHCSFGFWKGSLILGTDPNQERDGMGHFGRITSRADLPDDKTLIGYVRKAARLNETKVKSPTRSKPRTKPQPFEIPDYLAGALRKNAEAKKTFAGFSYSHQKEYVEWLTEAKRDATRAQRLAKTIEWLSEGKPRNWKHQRK
ncbi:MAG: YdeI/OmpD-associated family protein [Verrucomicrobiota bacterium]|nr:YdeI/OmpD-associated family protein [Verrucomicrobiota bacterium]